MARCAERRWVPRHAAGGHHGAVADMTWAFEDSALLTVSHDQTARAFGSLPTGGWCEVARPQVGRSAVHSGSRPWTVSRSWPFSWHRISDHTLT